MLYRFDTTDEPAAIAALLLYATYRSRDKTRFKVSPDMWEQMTRFVKASAKRARSLPEFLNGLMPRLCCGALNPRWMMTGERGLIAHTSVSGHTEYVESPDVRQFLTGILERADDAQVLKRLFKETAWIVLLVRDRLESEKLLESHLSEEEESL
jgi:hypothetical protein